MRFWCLDSVLRKYNPFGSSTGYAPPAPNSQIRPLGLVWEFLFISDWRDLKPKRVFALIKQSGGLFLAKSCAGGYRTRSVGSPSRADCIAIRGPATGTKISNRTVRFGLGFFVSIRLAGLETDKT